MVWLIRKNVPEIRHVVKPGKCARSLLRFRHRRKITQMFVGVSKRKNVPNVRCSMTEKKYPRSMWNCLWPQRENIPDILSRVNGGLNFHEVTLSNMENALDVRCDDKQGKCPTSIL